MAKRLAFGVWRLAFGVWRLALGAWRAGVPVPFRDIVIVAQHFSAGLAFFNASVPSGTAERSALLFESDFGSITA
jgi:hypothetical protein